MKMLLSIASPVTGQRVCAAGESAAVAAPVSGATVEFNLAGHELAASQPFISETHPATGVSWPVPQRAIQAAHPAAAEALSISQPAIREAHRLWITVESVAAAAGAAALAGGATAVAGAAGEAVWCECPECPECPSASAGVLIKIASPATTRPNPSHRFQDDIVSFIGFSLFVYSPRAGEGWDEEHPHPGPPAAEGGEGRCWRDYSFGTRFIPHFGQRPGASITTSECIGQVYLTAVEETGAALSCEPCE